MTSAVTWLGISGFAIMTILMSRNFRGSIIVGVLFVTIIAWIPGHSASYLGHTSNLPGALLQPALLSLTATPLLPMHASLFRSPALWPATTEVLST